MAIEFEDVPCQQVEDKEIFFPDPTDLVTIRQAKDVCNACEMTRECLIFALETDSYGIWGGMTYKERQRVRRRFNVTRRPTKADTRALTSNNKKRKKAEAV